MKAYKPNECDFLILNLLNEYDKESLMKSLLQDAKERQETFGDEFENCVQFAQTFSNAVFTQTARCLVNEKLIKEKVILWEMVQKRPVDVAQMERDFTELINFWKSIYLRKE